MFFINSALLGFALAMDAFSVSLANGLANPTMKRSGKIRIAGCFAFFQFLMPMIGWICVHTLVEKFTALQKFIPWIGFGLLLFIGGNMLREAFFGEEEEVDKEVSTRLLMVQGVATSIDALSVGFTIADYNLMNALICALIILAVTFVVCYIGLKIGIRFGMKLSKKAQILGGLILIGIGIEILVKSFLG